MGFKSPTLTIQMRSGAIAIRQIHLLPHLGNRIVFSHL